MTSILLVEDERPARERWLEGLKAEGLEFVKGVETAEEALAVMEERLGTERQFQLAVVDLKLESSSEPYRSDRWALPRALNRLDPKLVIILITGVYDDTIDQHIGLGVANRYLLKGEGGLTPKLLAANIFAVLRDLHQTLLSAPDRPLFRFEHYDQAEKGIVFTFDSATKILTDPKGVQLVLRSSDRWILELFVRKPNEIHRYGRISDDIVPDPIPIQFLSKDNQPLTQAVSRIGRILNPYLGSLSEEHRRFFSNVSNVGYIFHATVTLAPGK